MNKLKELRIQNGKTIEEVANELELPKTTYYNYESGRNEIDRDLLIKFADYYNVSLDYLYNRQYNNNIGYIPDNVKEVVRKLIKLDNIDLAKADAYISALLDK